MNSLLVGLKLTLNYRLTNTHRDRGYTVKEIQTMIERGCKGRLREKVVILLLTSAGGMRIGGIPKLKKEDLKEMRTSAGEKTYGISLLIFFK